MQRTTVGRWTAAAGICALLTWAHVALPEPARFALFCACVAGAVLAASGRVVPASPVRGAGPAAGLAVSACERDELRRLEAELHALEDQLASGAVDPDPRDGPAGAGPAGRGSAG